MSAVLLVITKEKEISHKLTWGIRLSRVMDLPLKVVYPEKYPKAETPILQDLEKSCSQPLLESIRKEIVAQQLDPPPSLYFLKGPDPLHQVVAFAEKESCPLLLTGQQEVHNNSSRVLRKKRDGLLDRASCDVLVIRGEETPKELNKILVTVAGGPHAIAALQVAYQLAKENNASITALHIEGESAEEAEGVGQLVLERVLNQMPPEARSIIKPKVVLSDNVVDGIEATAKEDEYDLVLLGASNTGFLRKSLFGNIPVKFLQRQVASSVAVLHSSQSVSQKASDYLRYQLNRILPQLKREERIALFENLRSGSKASIDFISLIGLSTMIAAFGLINNSAAVIIGAMLVAPLMTPMIGTGLGLVQGNVNLVREAIRAITIGFLLSLCLGALCGIIAFTRLGTHPALTAELLSRCHVNEYDFFIAILSGLAASYALARPGLMAALPGVAIAAALVPPIATVGITLVWGYPEQALNAASLFGINLLSIILASTVTLYMFGIRARHKQPRLWARRATVTLMLVASIVAIPLGTVLLAQVRPSEHTLKQSIAKFMTTQKTGHSLADIQQKPGHGSEPASIVIKLYSKRRVRRKLVRRLTQITREHMKKPAIKVRVVALRTWESSE